MADNKPSKKKSQSVSHQAGSSSFDANQRRDQVGIKIDPLASKLLLAQRHEETMSGPLPHAAEYARYEEVLPGAADRILAMAEREQAFRHEEIRTNQALDKKALNGFNWRGGVAQGAAFILTLSGFICGTFLGLNEQAELAKVVFGTTIGAVLTAFLIGQVSKVISPSKSENKEESTNA